jgi:outer membrane immunogenic protein
MIPAEFKYPIWSVAMRSLVLAVMVSGAVSAAHAADLPDFPILRGGLTEGLSTSRVNWEGFYVGAQGGYGWSNMNFKGSTSTVAAQMMSGLEMEQEQRISSWPIMGKVSVHGSGYGGFAGYNSQWDDVVLGVEASYMHGSFGGAQTDSMSRFFTLSSGYTDGVTYEGKAQIAISDMATIRGRAGYAMDCFLPYAFFGVALGQADIIRSAHIYGNQVNPAAAAGFQNVPFDVSATEGQYRHLIYGYSAGLGVDINLVGGLFARAEYEYIRYSATVDTSINTARLGLGYKF